MNMKSLLLASACMSLVGVCFAPDLGGGNGAGPTDAQKKAEADKAAKAAEDKKAKDKADADAKAKADADAKAKADEDEKAKAKAEADKQTEAKQARADVVAAVKHLDHTVPTDWLDNGKPSLERVRALAGNNRISQELLDEAAGDLVRINAAATVQTGEKSVLAEKDHPDFVDGALVEAVEVGQFGGALRKVGDQFYVTGILRPWMKRIKD